MGCAEEPSFLTPDARWAFTAAFKLVELLDVVVRLQAIELLWGIALLFILPVWHDDSPPPWPSWAVSFLLILFLRAAGFDGAAANVNQRNLLFLSRVGRAESNLTALLCYLSFLAWRFSPPLRSWAVSLSVLLFLRAAGCDGAAANAN